MRKKTVLRDQMWLRAKKAASPSEKRFLAHQFDQNNSWAVWTSGRAMCDLESAFAAVNISAEFPSTDERSLEMAMTVWLRENRKIVPSPSSFRRFFKKKSAG